MVTSQIPILSKNHAGKAFQNTPIFPKSAPEVLPSETGEFDFSDVFGSIPAAPLPSEENGVDPENIGDENGVDPENIGDDGTELIYDNPMVIHRRSRSLVGPSACVCHSLKSSMLTVYENKPVLSNEQHVTGEPFEELFEFSSDEDVKAVETEDGSLKFGRVGLEDFEVMKVVGKGAFGKVFQVRKKGTTEIYAMKVMRKDKIMENNHGEYMKAERDILTKIDHPFIVRLRYSFQTKYRLYLVLDFINGGHLFFQLYHQGLFREELGRIYAAEIVSAVAHLHANGIMHRDLKPENILLDADGHVVITDFGLAKEFQENERSNSMCGTVEYMAPEIVTGKGHDKAADWWSVGMLIFEMLTGEPPFSGANRKKVQEKIIKEKIKFPPYLTSDAHSLLKGLLQKDPSKRLGSGSTGIEEIKRHKWFKPINWKKLDVREIQPSFRPEVAGKHCIANFDKCWTEMPLIDSPAASPSGNGTLIFKDFSYVRPTGSYLQKSSPLNGSHAA